MLSGFEPLYVGGLREINDKSSNSYCMTSFRRAPTKTQISNSNQLTHRKRLAAHILNSG